MKALQVYDGIMLQLREEDEINKTLENCHLGSVAITLRDKRRLLPGPLAVRGMVKNDDCYDMLKLVMLSTFIELLVLLKLFVIKLCCQCVKYFYRTLHICRTCYN